VIPQTDPLLLFAPAASRDFGERVAAVLGLPLAEHEERDFPEGEHKARPLVNVRGRDIFVVHSLHADQAASVNDKLCRLLFFIGALRDASAGRITALVPYLCYARKDRKTQPRDPVTTRYVAALLEAVGVDCVVTIDVHNPAAFQNAFRCRTEHLEAQPLFVEHFSRELAAERVIVLSPDPGGLKRAERFRDSLAARLGCEVGLGLAEKQRALGELSGEQVFGRVEGASVIVLDDMIGTGGTIERAARACLARGARAVYAAATHGLFVGNAAEVVASPALAKVVVTDAVPPFRLPPELVRSKLVVLSVAPLFARAIEAIHTGGSIVQLLEATPADLSPG
jgi:ribose-phosphate pyrophosphokinase